MNRTEATLITLGLVGLAGLGLLADRAAVEAARARESEARAQVLQSARSSAMAARIVLADIETALVAGERVRLVEMGSFVAAKPDYLAALRDDDPIGNRDPRTLVSLLDSSDVTPNGLPVAAVAAIALDTDAARAQVAERLVSGRLPVAAGDLRTLAATLGVKDEARVRHLEGLLARAPELQVVPDLPAFARRVNAEKRIVGWSRRARELFSYELDLATLADRIDLASARLVIDTRTDDAASFVPVPGLPKVAVVVERHAVTGLLSNVIGLRLLTWGGVTILGLVLLAFASALKREREVASRERGFLESLSHELRTPLAGLRLLGETLASGQGRPIEHGALIAAESERLEGLLGRSLAVAQGIPTPRVEACDAVRLVRAAVAVAQPRAERRHVLIATALPEGPEMVEWDPVLVQGAMLNLVDNAVRHGREWGRVDVGIERRDDAVAIRVNDDGPGIMPRDRSRLFGRFARGSAETSGIGLGLHIVDGVAKSHGGRVELESRPGKGCTFTLVLPRRGPA